MLRPITTDVWQLVAEPLRLPGGVRMPLASTVFRLPDRTLAIYSPVSIDDAAAAELAALGEVAHIIAPNLLHHLYAAAATTRWPRATVHAAPGLAAKRADLEIHRELGRDAEPAWRDILDTELVAGAPRINEAVLFHRPSGTLACADLVFNVTQPANLRTRMVLGMMGVGGRKLGQSRVWKFAARDRAATRASLDRILAWPIAHVAPVHGEAVAIDAAAFAPKLSRAYGGVAKPLLATHHSSSETPVTS